MTGGAKKMEKQRVELGKNSYDILIGKGIFDKVGNLINEIRTNARVYLITDKNVDLLYGDMISEYIAAESLAMTKYIIEPGEQSKSFETYEDILNDLAEKKFTRNDIIVTFGGGVVGDLGGFVAATYLRGLEFVQVPTTLLSQVDSSVGGKVAINIPAGKNLVGCFYQPRLVIIDPLLLNTLDNQTFNDGLGEVIKYGCIYDLDFFERLERSGNRESFMAQAEEHIATCCSIKRQIVQVDERDTGLRMILNFGHTLGHGIEKYFNYAKYTHGHSVAIGMVKMTESSEKMGFTKGGTTDRLRGLLEQFQIGYDFPKMNSEDYLNALLVDKKTLGNVMKVILLKEIGQCEIVKIDKKDIIKYY